MSRVGKLGWAIALLLIAKDISLLRDARSASRDEADQLQAEFG